MRDDQPGGPIRWRMHLAVPPERVFAALDSSQDRAAFWAESAVEHDGAIHFSFINGYRCTCKVLKRRSPHEWTLDYIGGVARFEPAWLVHGIDLRNHDPARSWDEGYADQ